MMDILEENSDRQQEEKLAVCAIYGNSILKLDEHNTSDTQAVYSLTLNVDQSVCNDMGTTAIHYKISSPRIMVLRLFFPSSYPSHDMPVFEMTSVYCGNTKIDASMVDAIQQGFHSLFQPGQVVLFEWIQWLEDYIRYHVEPTIQTDMGAADTTNNSNNDDDADDGKDTADLPAAPSSSADALTVSVPSIFSSLPLVDRKSTFVAHVAAVKTLDQVKHVISTLLENKKIARATHNIMAYRINLPGNNILQDNDDDGETAAGGRLMHLLQILDVKDVVVVVSRWFGGVLLGPDRFKDINNCARQALEDCGYLHDIHKKKHKSSAIGC
ncbi:ribosomal protein S5 domain 2-type protein, partial [Absidia repens]